MFSFIGAIIKSLINVLKIIFKPILFIIGIVLIIVLAAAWIAAIISLFFGQSYLVYLFPDQLGLATASVGSLFLMVGLPLVSLLFFLSRFLFRTRVSPFWRRSVLVLNIFAWLFFFGSVSYFSKNFQESRTTETLSQTIINTDVLEVVSLDNNEYQNIDEYFHFEEDGRFSFFRGSDEMVIANTEVNFRKSKDNQIRVRQLVTSRGRSGQESKKLAETLNYKVSFEGNKLIIPKYYTIPKGSKFRGQKINVIIEIPEGISVRDNEDVKRITDDFNTDGDRYGVYWDCTSWKMGEKGFVCIDEKANTEEVENMEKQSEETKEENGSEEL